MKLLIITRKVDIHDERIGFFIDWLNEFAHHIEQLYVISMQQGSGEGLQENITVSFVETPYAFFIKPLRRFLMFFRYKRLIKEVISHTDGVFVHMIPLYASLAGPLAKKYKKRLFLWYTHKSVNNALKRTEKWVEGYITASKESFRMHTKKPVYAVGHGINIEKLTLRQAQSKKPKVGNGALKILTVGRLSPAKNLETLIEAVKVLITDYGLRITCSIIGAPALESDYDYLKQLKLLVKKYNLEKSIKFAGPKTHSAVIEAYKYADIFVNCSETGSLDKTVLEAMASGLVVVTSNEAFVPLLTEYSELLITLPHNAHNLAERMYTLSRISDNEHVQLSNTLRAIVEKNHNLPVTVQKIVGCFKSK